ncbi:hypothetical protein [Nereida sp. MMG025]|uniref:hypothetical protein n=1 Tax=Nereida sp. MMG025 TaxID=2909981 RepID=UPI001F438E70|nr:hypothetical protein [Nereida sp. MMG025]MCF6444026.1 hypothetical protein [Nereida sp. MMG025]
MKHLLIIAALAVAAPVVTAPSAEAKIIKRACMQSDRKAANRSLCGCIQQAADATLSRSDQRLASKFFKDPHRAQEVRQSDNRSHETFWRKYKNFGQTAQAYCS